MRIATYLLLGLFAGGCQPDSHDVLMMEDAGPPTPWPKSPMLSGDESADIRAVDADVRFLGRAGAHAGTDVDFIGDIDGDGFDDVAILERDYFVADDDRRNALHIVYGRTGLGGDVNLEDADATIITEAYSPYSAGSARAGDVDGDGLDDVLCFGAYVVWGSRARLAGRVDAADVATVFRWPEFHGSTVAPGGDLDRDGLNDVVVGLHVALIDGTTESLLLDGEVFVFYGRRDRFGGANPSVEDADVRITSDHGGGSVFGRSMTAAGDLDGDGFDDLVIGQVGRTVPTVGRVFVFRGGAERWPRALGIATAHVIDPPDPGDDDISFGLVVEVMGDLDGDGDDELLVSNPGRAEVAIFEGGLALPTGADPVITYRGAPNALPPIGGSGGGDLDGDGALDVVIAAGHNGLDPGRVFGLFGGLDRIRGAHDVDAYDLRFIGGRHDEREGVDSTGVAAIDGDFNADGHADLLIGANNTFGGRGRAYLIYGR